ncbi:MAG: hypothetical protein ACFNYQ_07040 [Treponema sp.]|uniref:hypothetical protein n=1 Tax=Treponema sp. TaxID=166 RepID=UPI00360B04B2
MEVQTFVGLVEEMRKKQKEYSSNRSLAAYQQSQILEKEVDAAILQFKRDVGYEAEQWSLF